MAGGGTGSLEIEGCQGGLRGAGAGGGRSGAGNRTAAGDQIRAMQRLPFGRRRRSSRPHLRSRFPRLSLESSGRPAGKPRTSWRESCSALIPAATHKVGRARHSVKGSAKEKSFSMSDKWVDRKAAAWHALWDRCPGLGWLRTWGVSGISICSGLVTLLIFRRGIEYFPLVIGYLLLLWLAGVLLAEHRQRLSERAPRAVTTAIDYTVQTLLHGLLLFLLPIYYASTTLTSGNVWFLLVLVGASILTTIDPWYRTGPNRLGGSSRALWARVVFRAECGFSSHRGGERHGAPPERRPRACWLSAPSSAGAWVRGGWRRRCGPGCGAVAIAVGLWLVREWMPPVPLHLTHYTFARAVDHLEPVEPAVRIAREDCGPGGDCSPIRRSRLLPDFVSRCTTPGRRTGGP